MKCAYYRKSLCRSCTSIETPYTAQLKAKQADARALLAAHRSLRWLEPVPSTQRGFRNKAKLVVGGTAENPTLGLVDYRTGVPTDLSACPLHTEPIVHAIPVLAELIRRAHLSPYNIPNRRGELKNIVVTASATGQLMVRFVLRSKKLLVPIRKQLPWLSGRLPNLAVASINLLREHVALIEGDEEIILTKQQTLPMRVNGMTLHLRPQSFFQTNTAVAEAMYVQGRQWVQQVRPGTLWDMYCGVGGFALHAASVIDGGTVTGIELSSQAITSARRTVAEYELSGLQFIAADATEYALGAAYSPQLLVVNPPRRGIGERLCRWLEDSAVQHVIYSSCNAKTLAADVARMPSYTPVEARLLDMFPNSTHYETMMLLQRR